MPTLQGAWNAFWGVETKASAPPLVPPPQVQSLVWSPSSYPDAAGDYWNPLIATGSGSTTTWNSAVFACLALKAKAFQEAPLRIFRFQGDGTEEWLDDAPVHGAAGRPPPLALPAGGQLLALHLPATPPGRRSCARSATGPARWCSSGRCPPRP